MKTLATALLALMSFALLTRLGGAALGQGSDLHGPTGPKPIDVLPGAAGIAEVLPGFETWEWNGVFEPAATDAALITRLNEEMNAAIRLPATAARLAELGALTRANTVAEFAAFRDTQIAFFAEMVKTADIRIE